MSNIELLKILSDYKAVSAMEKEIKKEKEKLSDIIKTYMEDRTELIIGEYRIDYKEIVKLVADSEKMKTAGIFQAFSKEQKSRPLYVR